jgi:signal-transduction protein with cAMP-binding, CBS, and nucleotidyltransferase domain
MSMTVASFSAQFPGIAEHCGPKGLDDLLLALQTRNVKAGEEVTTEGEDCDSLFLVSSGKLVTQVTNDVETSRLGSLQAGDHFGEVNILDPGPSTTTVLATEDSVLLVLTHADFRDLDKAHPVMTGNILRMLCELVIERCRVADQLLFSKYSHVNGTSNKFPNLTEWGLDILQKLHGHKEVQS